jgi:MFS family permease
MENLKNKKYVVAAVFIATFMSAIEGTIVTTAMPTIIADLKGIDIMNWVFAIYMFVMAILTPFYGKLSDIYGNKKLFMVGISIFMIGSILSGLSFSMPFLIFSRFIQAIGGAAINPLSLTIIADLYEKESERAKMLGLTSGAWGIASVVGPLFGGVIVAKFSWHWIFLINIPVGIVVLYLFARFYHKDIVTQTKQKLDVKGGIFISLALLLLMFLIQEIENSGFNLFIILGFIMSMALFYIFYQVEKKSDNPLIPISLFSKKKIVLINLCHNIFMIKTGEQI